MVTLFYLLGIIFFLHELVVLRDPKKFLKKVKGVEKKTPKEGSEEGKKTITSWNELSDTQKGTVRMALLGMAYFLWSIIGVIFSSQWILFLIFMATGHMLGFIRRRFYKDDTRGSITLIKIDSTVSIVMLTLVILNHFHHIL